MRKKDPEEIEEALKVIEKQNRDNVPSEDKTQIAKAKNLLKKLRDPKSRRMLMLFRIS